MRDQAATTTGIQAFCELQKQLLDEQIYAPKREARRMLKMEYIVTREDRREWKTVVVESVVESCRDT